MSKCFLVQWVSWVRNLERRIKSTSYWSNWWNWLLPATNEITRVLKVSGLEGLGEKSQCNFQGNRWVYYFLKILWVRILRDFFSKLNGLFDFSLNVSVFDIFVWVWLMFIKWTNLITLEREKPFPALHHTHIQCPTQPVVIKVSASIWCHPIPELNIERSSGFEPIQA